MVATVNASIPPLQQQLRQSIDALAILIGSTPEGVDVTHGSLDELAEPLVRPGLPSELLARRPDVAEAEAQLIAANANIAAGARDFFPSITLTASGGYESAALAGLLTPANRVWSLGAGARSRSSTEAPWSASTSWTRGTTTSCSPTITRRSSPRFRNVEDSLVAVGQTREQVARQQQADPHRRSVPTTSRRSRCAPEPLTCSLS